MCVHAADATLDELTLQYLSSSLGVQTIDTAKFRRKTVPPLGTRLRGYILADRERTSTRDQTRETGEPHGRRPAAGTRNAEQEGQRRNQAVVHSDHGGLKGIKLRLRSTSMPPSVLRFRG
jgi:hypothetical protein